MLRSRFGATVDREEIYQEAWAELLELQADGYEIEDRRKLLRTIAWRRARDRMRDWRPEPMDPASRVLALHGDPAPLPDEAAQVHLDAGAVRVIVESLDPRQAQVIKLRFEDQLELRQIRALLGMTTKTLDRLISRPATRSTTQLALRSDGESEWERRQRSLLLLCLLGRASPRQRARAQRMVEQDVHCRAMLRQLRCDDGSGRRDRSVPVLAEEAHSRHGVVFLDRIHDCVSLPPRISWGTSLSRAGERLPTGEKAAAGGTAAVGAGAAKVAVGCLIAGTAAVCVAPALFPSPHPPRTSASRDGHSGSRPRRSPA